jgi:murein peptide amidase A
MALAGVTTAAHSTAKQAPAPTPTAAVAATDPCVEWVPRLPNVSAQLCSSAALKPTVGRTVKARTIFARDVVAQEPKVRVLVVGAMHGDELSSASMALHCLTHIGVLFLRLTPMVCWCVRPSE